MTNDSYDWDSVVDEILGDLVALQAERADAQKEQAKDGKWVHVGNVIGGGSSDNFKASPKIKLEAFDDKGSLHVNNVPYKATFSKADADGQPVPGAYPLYKGVLSTGLSGALSTDRIFDFTPSDSQFIWTIEIQQYEKSCDNCGQPGVNIYEYR